MEIRLQFGERLRLASVVAAYSMPIERDQSGGATTAGENGQFQLNGLAPGRYGVMIIPGDDEREITVEEGETATVDLRN